MITKDLHLPYDKTKLIKKFKNMDYNKLYLREEEYYEDHGIDFQLAREAVNVVNRHGGPYIELSDGYNLVICYKLLHGLTISKGIRCIACRYWHESGI